MGALIGRFIDEGMHQERAMLAQAETKSKVPFGQRNGRPDKSDGLDPQFAKLKKKLTLTHREIKSQEPTTPSQGEHREGTCGARFKKDDPPDEEVGSKRFLQQAKRANASRQGTSPPSPPWKGFKMLPTGDNSDLKIVFRNRMYKQHTRRQNLLAFNQLSRRRLHKWMLSPDLRGQGQGKL
jgi:hypothetical protein